MASDILTKIFFQPVVDEVMIHVITSIDTDVLFALEYTASLGQLLAC